MNHDTLMKTQIKKWFDVNGEDFSNWTEAAQICADELGHLEWLDDSAHVLWDIAVDYCSNE